MTLALGIGANASIFSIVSGVLLRPLPYADPDRLVQINQVLPSFGLGAVRNLQEYRAGSTQVEAMAGYVPTSRVVQESAGPDRIGIVLAERSLFRVLGVAAAFGRTFRDDDPTSVLVAGAELARRRFGSGASAVGRTIALEGQELTIIGVMPETFQFPYSTARLPGTLASARVELWGVLEPPRNPRTGIDFTVARLKPGSTRLAARDELNATRGGSRRSIRRRTPGSPSS